MNDRNGRTADSGGKLLSVSVAAYNMEAYLEETLESCIVENHEDLEVIVVDDGSSDRTAQIASRYVAQYPGLFVLISKGNGGYGTTVNTALAYARGKYFRLLDGDDWFDRDGLRQLLADLRDLECDLVITPLVEVYESEERVLDQATPDVSGLCSFEDGLVLRELNMHSSTYRTDLLRQVGLTLPKRRLYTDLLFVSTPLRAVETVFVSHVPLYRYRLSREDQSVAITSQIRHRDDKVALIDDLIGLYLAVAGRAAARSVIGIWVTGTCGFHLRMLYSMEPSAQNKAEVRGFTEHIRSYPEIYKLCRKQSKWFRLLTDLGFAYRPASWVARAFGGLVQYPRKGA